jgi:sigma-70-like protein
VTQAELERRDRRLRRFAAAVAADRRRADAALERAYPRALGLDAVHALRLVLRECARGPVAVALPPGDARRAALDRVLHRLSPRERAVLHLVAVAGLEEAEAAAVLGLTAGETRRLLAGAELRLRRALLDESLFGNEVDLFDEAVEAHVGYLRPGRLLELQPAPERLSRRTATAVLGLVVLAAAAGAAFLAARPVAAAVLDETWSCNAGAGIQVAVAGGFLHLAPALQIRDDPQEFALGTRGCRLTQLHVALPPDSPRATHIAGAFAAACDPEKTVVLRARITLSHGVATRAEVAVRDGRSGRAIAYVDWSPKRIASWVARGCTAFPV